MTAKEYEKYVAATAKSDMGVAYAVIGLNEEAGEVAGWYKKYVLRGNLTGKYSLDDLKEELGDVQFYLTRIASLHGWTLSDVMKQSKRKLEKRKQKRMRIIA